MFAGNRKIRSLQVLSFTNIKRLGYGNLKECYSLESITIPKSVDVIDWYVFGNGRKNETLTSLKNVIVEKGKLSHIPEGFDNNIKDVVDYPSTISSFGWAQPSLRAKVTIVRTTTPPTVDKSSFNGEGIIYVPDDVIDAYRHSGFWSRVADRIYPLSDYRP